MSDKVIACTAEDTAEMIEKSERNALLYKGESLDVIQCSTSDDKQVLVIHSAVGDNLIIYL